MFYLEIVLFIVYIKLVSILKSVNKNGFYSIKGSI